MRLSFIPEKYKDVILKMQWVIDLASREYEILEPLVGWLRDGDRRYADIPPGLRKEVFYKDIRTGEIHACTTWEALGYGTHEMAKTNWVKKVHPEDREQITLALRHYTDTNRIGIGQCLFRIFDANGETHWLLTTMAAISRSEDGNVDRYVGRDVEVGSRIERELSLKRRINEVEDLWFRERALIESAGEIAGSTEETGLLEAMEKASVRLFHLKNVRIVVLDEEGFRTVVGPDLPESVTKDELKDIDRLSGSSLARNLKAWYIGEVDENRGIIILAEGDDPGPVAGKLMRTLGPIVLGAWERIRHIKTLRHHALTDPLTGIWNRRAFRQQAGRALRRCIAEGPAAAAAIMDIDHFKNINDEFGHPFGDRVLMEVSHGMHATLRSGDFMCRWGGEEFAFYIDSVEANAVFDIVERIRVAAGRSCDEMGLTLTLSAGVHIIDSGHNDSLELALKNADAALLKAKRSGRNQTVFSDGGGVSPKQKAIEDSVI